MGIGHAEGSGMSSHTVLVVDDDRSFVDAAAVYLGNHGYHVVKAYSGRTGLAHLRSNAIDLAIIDIHLPDFNGAELAIIRHHLEKPVPVILISGHHDAATREAAILTGAEAFLPKPLSPQRLLATIARMLSGAESPPSQTGPPIR
jgi:two-component system response regulator VanR